MDAGSGEEAHLTGVLRSAELYDDTFIAAELQAVAGHRFGPIEMGREQDAAAGRRICKVAGSASKFKAISRRRSGGDAGTPGLISRHRPARSPDAKCRLLAPQIDQRAVQGQFEVGSARSAAMFTLAKSSATGAMACRW